MRRILLGAIPSTAVTLLGAAVVIFLLVRLTGDPASIMLPTGTPADIVDQYRQKLGLDQPIYVQFAHYLAGLLRGDLGMSIRYEVPVLDLLMQRLPATAQLALCAMVLAVVIGVPLGVVGGLRPNSAIDNLGRALAALGQAIPVFYLGIILVLVFAVGLRVLPPFGSGTFAHLVLPSVTLAAYLVPLILRVTRGGVLDEVPREYLVTARAQGLTETRVVGVHMLRNALLPAITVIGMQFGAVLGGSIITEAVFGWPGLGQLLVNGISTRDFPVVQGVVLFMVLAVVACNVLVDVVQAVLDPRTRVS